MEQLFFCSLFVLMLVIAAAAAALLLVSLWWVGGLKKLAWLKHPYKFTAVFSMPVANHSNI